MNGFEAAAFAMLLGVVPCAVVARRGKLIEAVIAFEVIVDIVVLVVALLAKGFGRSGEFEFPIIVALLSLGGGLVFVRALERWL